MAWYNLVVCGPRAGDERLKNIQPGVVMGVSCRSPRLFPPSVGQVVLGVGANLYFKGGV